MINEESTGWLVLTFEDRNGVPVTPDSLEYRIDAGSNQIVELTSLPLQEQVSVELTADQNKILSEYVEDRYQENVVTVIATLNNDKQQTKDFKYKIRNMRYIP